MVIIKVLNLYYSFAIKEISPQGRDDTKPLHIQNKKIYILEAQRSNFSYLKA